MPLVCGLFSVVLIGCRLALGLGLLLGVLGFFGCGFRFWFDYRFVVCVLALDVVRWLGWVRVVLVVSLMTSILELALGCG